MDQRAFRRIDNDDEGFEMKPGDFVAINECVIPALQIWDISHRWCGIVVSIHDRSMKGYFYVTFLTAEDGLLHGSWLTQDEINLYVNVVFEAPRM